MYVRNLLGNSTYFSDRWCFSIRVRFRTSFDSIFVWNNSHHSCVSLREIRVTKNELLSNCINYLNSHMSHFCSLRNRLLKAFFLFIVLSFINSHYSIIGDKNDHTYAHISRFDYCQPYSVITVLKTVGTNRFPNFLHSCLCCYQPYRSKKFINLNQDQLYQESIIRKINTLCEWHSFNSCT